MGIGVIPGQGTALKAVALDRDDVAMDHGRTVKPGHVTVNGRPAIGWALLGLPSALDSTS